MFGAKTCLLGAPRGTISPLPSPRRGRLTVGFCFGDRDFVTASPGVYAILCSCKERLCQESTLRGLRREVRFIMSPPGKRRHNELNAAPPPETPGETGKPGEVANRDVVHSGESFGIRGRNLFAQRAARHDSAFAFPSRGRLTVGFCLADRGGAIPPHREKPKNNKF